MKLGKAVLEKMLADMEEQGIEIGTEMRGRVKPLAEASADLALRALQGEAVAAPRKVLAARAKNLEAAGIIGAARIASQATRSAVFAALEEGFGLLGAAV